MTFDGSPDSDDVWRAHQWSGQVVSRQVLWRRPLVTGLATAVVVTVLATFVALLMIYRVYLAPSGGMRPTIGVGTYLVLNATRQTPRDGDIVVFHDADWWPSDPSASGVKRVLATSGQVISCCRSGAVVRNGTSLAEPYLATEDADTLAAFPSVTVPKGRLWMMGDNRAMSADSRFHISDDHQGTVSADDVVGTVVAHGSHLAMYLYILARTASVGLATGFAVYIWRRRSTSRVRSSPLHRTT
jgi:signal peptidase I